MILIFDLSFYTFLDNGVEVSLQLKSKEEIQLQFIIAWAKKGY